MFEFICKKFIPDYENVTDKNVRERYGTVFSVFSIICNVIMVAFKLFVSFLTGSVSIRADAFNNLSDVGSNLAALFGFKLSNKHPDADHPYGHGRMEYVSGLIVSFLILFMGIEALIEAIGKIINPSELSYSSIALIVLLVSIGIKLVMSYVNKKAGKKIDSETLNAAGQDSFNDAIMTFATLICLLVFRFTGLNLDAYVGLVVSLFVIKSGIEIFKGVLDTILGSAPDKELIEDIDRFVNSHEGVLGIHDLMVHDYGPSSKFMTFHIEVDAAEDVLKSHDMIDNIEREILDRYGILTTIHMDPVEKNDELTNELREKVRDIVKGIDERYNIHDFRIVTGPTHTNLVFDVVIPSEDESDHAVIKNKIQEALNKLPETYYCVITVEHSFV